MGLNCFSRKKTNHEKLNYSWMSFDLMHWTLGKFFIRKVIGWKLPVKEICGGSRVQVGWELDSHGAETVRKPSEDLGAA